LRRLHVSRPFASAGLVALALIAAVHEAGADEPGPVAAETETGPPGEPAPGAPRAVVTLVGAGEQTAELAALLRELLERDGVAVTLVPRTRFNPREVLVGGDADASVAVFVDLSDPRTARLYFRGPRAERFLLRQVPLASGMDDVAREQLGQVIEAATTSLFASAAGLSREQARVAIEHENPPAQRPVPHAAPPAPARAPAVAPARAPAPASPGLEPRVGVRYGFELPGGALDVRHGPGLELGLERRAALVIGGGLTLERSFAQAVRVAELQASQQVDGARLGLRGGIRVATHHVFSLELAAGIDAARLEPGAARSAGVTPAAPSTHVTPVLRSEIRYELAFSHWTLAALVLADIALQKTHFDLASGGTPQRLRSVSTLRPGAALALGWRFGR
jgi:hypothetical protein